MNGNRSEYARTRLRQQEATGATLSDNERAALKAMIPVAEVIGEIEHAILVYWQMLHDADDDDRAKLDKAARLAAELRRESQNTKQ